MREIFRELVHYDFEEIRYVISHWRNKNNCMTNIDKKFADKILAFHMSDT